MDRLTACADRRPRSTVQRLELDGFSGSLAESGQGDTSRLRMSRTGPAAEVLGLPWALTANHAEVVNLAALAATFTAGMTVTTPRGLLFDIQPHGLPQWSTDLNDTANQFLDLLPALLTEAQNRSVDLMMAIPSRYDTVTVTRDLQGRPLSEWMVDAIGDMVVSANRDHADPPDGIVDSVATEITYAESRGSRVMISVDTTCSGVPAPETFCEEGQAVMETELAEVVAQYGSSTAFDVVAIHDHAAYTVLSP